jgi:hypothetical protein
MDYYTNDDRYHDEIDAIFSGRWEKGKWFNAGWKGIEPEWTEGERYGIIPECGRSYNHATGTPERGVSVLTKGNARLHHVYAAWYDAEDKIKIGGWWLGDLGSDGERVLVDCIKLD